MSDPFRDDFGGQAAANAFSNHIGVAEDQLEHIEKIPHRFDGMERGDGITQQLMDQLAIQWAKGWENAWEQLQQAREVVAKKGRDVSEYDAARAAAGDIYTNVAKATARNLGSTVEISWRNVSTKTARDAAAALRAAMPEVVVVKQAPIDIDLRGGGAKTLDALYIAGGIGVVLLVVYLIYRAVTG